MKDTWLCRYAGLSVGALSLMTTLAAPPAPAAPQAHPALVRGGTADNGDGTFTDPVLYGDYPDIISQGVHAYLKTRGVPHVWSVDGHAHDATEWRNNLYYFLQRVFR